MAVTIRGVARRKNIDSLNAQSDAVLIRAIRSGEESAAAILFERYSARVRALAHSRCHVRFAGRFDADDIVQAVFRGFFSGVVKNLDQAPKDDQLWGLLTALTFNEIRHQIEYHQAAKRTVHRTIQSADLHSCPTTVHGQDSSERLELLVEELLSRQPPSSREIIQFRLEGYDLKEIASRTGRSLRTVERVLHDFRTRIAQRRQLA